MSVLRRWKASMVEGREEILTTRWSISFSLDPTQNRTAKTKAREVELVEAVILSLQ